MPSSSFPLLTSVIVLNPKIKKFQGGNEKKNGVSLLLPLVKTFMEVPAEVGFKMWPLETALFRNVHIYS